MKKLNIETSQHVQIKYPPAGIESRLGAFFIDLIVLGVYLFFTLVILFDVAPDSMWLFFIIVILPVMSYHLIMELLLDGQSLGKKAVDIKVVKKDGTPATFGSYILRWIFRLFEISMTSGTVAFFAILINGKGQRLGDMAAGTTVVKLKKDTTLSDTLFTDVEDDYSPRYPDVDKLNDDDISVIKEVLNEGGKYDRNTYLVMLAKTRNAIQQKMGVREPENTNPSEFLRTVVKDYNVIHG